ncbi:MAG: signal peptidase I [Deltaproteobacteria bacterium]|nr:signal peptidase I [Deltaproteobacteria bacterium]
MAILSGSDDRKTKDTKETAGSGASGHAKEKDKQKEQVPFFSLENFKSLGILAAIVLAIRWSIISPYYVPTSSMVPTIKEGDRLLALKLAYNLRLPFTDIILYQWRNVERGDIIVFKYPNDPKVDYVKRVVGLPGDRIRLRDDVLYVNDQPQLRVSYNHQREILQDIEDNRELRVLFKENLDGKEHWTVNMKSELRHFSQSNWPETGRSVTVPEDSVYVLGDNRDNSADSRVWGKVPLSNIQGKAIVVLWSLWHPDDGRWFALRMDRFWHWLDGDVSKD